MVYVFWGQSVYSHVHMYVDKEAVVLQKFAAVDVLPAFTVSFVKKQHYCYFGLSLTGSFWLSFHSLPLSC